MNAHKGAEQSRRDDMEAGFGQRNLLPLRIGCGSLAPLSYCQCACVLFICPRNSANQITSHTHQHDNSKTLVSNLFAGVSLMDGLRFFSWGTLVIHPDGAAVCNLGSEFSSSEVHAHAPWHLKACSIKTAIFQSQ